MRLEKDHPVYYLIVTIIFGLAIYFLVESEELARWYLNGGGW